MVKGLAELLDGGAINLDEVMKKPNMEKRIHQEKAMHPYKIHYTEKRDCPNV